jgi:addiction module RelE/StbE family toxin
MREVIWANSAVNDLERLREFIAKENQEAAKRAAETIKQSVQQLLSLPNIGKPVADLFGYRDLTIRFGAAGYILRYRVYDNTIYVLHIRHYREEDFKI